MKVSVKWLRELVDLPMAVEEIAHRLTMGGLEVEEVTPVAAAFSGIVVGHVKSVAPHPDADKLRVAEVDAGTGETLTIVCGAPNVAAGQKVPCALVGAKLPSARSRTGVEPPLEIRKAKLRGVESSGMLCSARELGLSEDHAGLLELEPDAPVGRDVRELLELDDVYLTLKLTPNRGDCLSMFGVARDVAAITGRALRLPEAPVVPATIPDVRAIRISEAKACGHYFGRVIRGIDSAARTPEWMRRRIERAGLRAIHPLVDITNYVMLERGQPMHAFDSAKLRGAVDVRFMKPSEQIELLNGQWGEYLPNLLAITDESGPVALGGVMGGLATMVTGSTTEVFFESAYFDPGIVQGKAKELSLASDAAYRFERGVDFAATRSALERATELTLAVCGGSAGPVTHATGELPRRESVKVRPARVRKLLGYEVEGGEMASILRRLACEVQERDGVLAATPPSWRFDLALEEDFVEEVARIHGYEHVPATPPRSSVPMLRPREGERDRYDLRRELAAHGYQEVVNYSFVSEASEEDFAGNAIPVRLANPIASHMGVMRSTLLGGLVQTLRTNLNRGAPRVRIFEIGRCFLGDEADLAVQPERIAALAFGTARPEQWGEAGRMADFFDVKGDVESMVGEGKALEFEAGVHPACHPGRCATVVIAGRAIGVVGELHPRLQQKYELPAPALLFELETGPLLAGAAPRFRGVSKMPAVRRDIAEIVPDSVPAEAILKAVRSRLPAFVREFALFDQYRGKGVESGKKSLAFRIVIQDTERTLTDSEVEAVVASIREQLHQQFESKPRT